MNHRRKLLKVVGAGVVTAPFPAFAQPQPRIWRVGFLALAPRPADLESHFYGGFLRGMRELGYVDGKNLVIEWRFAGGEIKRLPALAMELVQQKVDAIVTGGSDAPQALRKLTSVIPIVLGSASDPVGAGLIQSLPRPGGNITGVTTMAVELGPKRLEMLRAMVPNLSRVATLVNTDSVNHVKGLQSLRDAAPTLGMTIVPIEVRSREDIDKGFVQMRRQKVEGLLVPVNPLFMQQGAQIAALATKHRMPVIAGESLHAEAGCLMSYGADLSDGFRRAAGYVDKIFKGRKPADLPVEQPVKFELVINGKTARALGLAIPQSLLISANKIIE